MLKYYVTCFGKKFCDSVLVLIGTCFNDTEHQSTLPQSSCSEIG